MHTGKNDRHNIAWGDQLFFPKKPKLKPHHILDTTEALRKRRLNYDWKAYNPEGLSLMQEYWDSCIAEFASRLPSRFQEPSGEIHGINLGTFNGAFQRAWMNKGYKMFGVEHDPDASQELASYGCDGVQADFFDMPHVQTDRFDFGIVERALCSPHYEKTRPRKLFQEMLRIIKPNGALMGTLYEHWGREVVEELASEGTLELFLVPTSKWPMLGFTLDRSGSTTAVPTLEDQMILLREFVESNQSHELAHRQGIGNIRTCTEGTLAHLLIDNEIAMLPSGPNHSPENERWTTSKWSDVIFTPKVTWKVPSNADGIILSGSRPLINVARKELGLADCSIPIKGARPASAAAKQLTSHRGGIAIVDVTVFDAKRTRRGGNRVPLEQHRFYLEQLIGTLLELDMTVALILPAAAHHPELPNLETYLKVDRELAETFSLTPITMLLDNTQLKWMPDAIESVTQAVAKYTSS